MTDQAPPAPQGCVYGPWWDDSLQWLAIADDRHGRWLAIYDHEGWGLYDVDFYEPSAYFVPELLRLAKENAELRASQPSEEDRAVLWLMKEKGMWIGYDAHFKMWFDTENGCTPYSPLNPAEEARNLGWEP